MDEQTRLTLAHIATELSELKIEVAKLKERICPVIKIVYGIVSLAMVSIGAALIALVMKQGAAHL